MTRLVLASQSATRMRLLKAAGIAFTAVAPSVDERAMEVPLILRHASPAEIAAALADAKAIDVSESEKTPWIIMSDSNAAAATANFLPIVIWNFIFFSLSLSFARCVGPLLVAC